VTRSGNFLPRTIDIPMAATENIKAVRKIRLKENDDGRDVAIP
jgi:hypothetical protein